MYKCVVERGGAWRGSEERGSAQIVFGALRRAGSFICSKRLLFLKSILLKNYLAKEYKHKDTLYQNILIWKFSKKCFNIKKIVYLHTSSQWFDYVTEEPCKA